MSIKFNDNIFVQFEGKLLDAKWGPFESESAANNFVPIEYRQIGMFAIIARPNSPAELYWYKNGTKNEDLVPFTGNSSVQVFESFQEFPLIGSLDVLYVDKSTNSSFYWDLSLVPANYSLTGTVQVYPKLLPNLDADPPEVAGIDFFPLFGEENVIYVANDTDIAYTWNLVTNTYIPISKGSIDLLDNTGLEFNSENKLKTIYNTLIDDVRDSQVIGDLVSKKAEYWKTKNIVEVLNEILFPLTLPEYNPTTINLVHTLTNPYYEIGSPQTDSLTLTAVKNDAGDYTNLSLFRKEEGDANFTLINSVDNPPFTGTTNKTYSIDYDDNINVSPGITTWTGNGDYLSGIIKNDSDGNPDTRPPLVRNPNAPQKFQFDFDSNDVTINGIYPYYYGYIIGANRPLASEIATLVNNYSGDTPQIRRVLKPLTSTENVFFNAENPCWMWIAHTGTPKTNYITENQPIQTDITSGSLFDSNQITAFTEANDYWTNVNFNLYIASRLSSTSGNYWFKFR